MLAPLHPSKMCCSLIQVGLAWFSVINVASCCCGIGVTSCDVASCLSTRGTQSSPARDALETASVAVGRRRRLKAPREQLDSLPADGRLSSSRGDNGGGEQRADRCQVPLRTRRESVRGPHLSTPRPAQRRPSAPQPGNNRAHPASRLVSQASGRHPSQAGSQQTEQQT